MKKIFNKEVLKKILIFFILLQPLLDTYILFDEVTIDIFGISPSTVIRLMFIMVMGVISIFVIRSKKQWKYYIIYIFLSLIYSVFHNRKYKRGLFSPRFLGLFCYYYCVFSKHFFSASFFIFRN